MRFKCWLNNATTQSLQKYRKKALFRSEIWLAC